MRRSIKKLSIIVTLVMIISMMFSATAFAASKTVTIRIQGYHDGNGEILDEYEVVLTDTTGFTVMDAFEEAATDNSISYTESGGYVSAVAGQTDQDYPSSFFGGWMYRVWDTNDQPASPTLDELPSVGAASYTLNDGDKISWYYALPEYTYYTCLSNYSSINSTYNENSSFDVTVKGQIFTDLWNWTISLFEELGSATVVVERVSDGAILASSTTATSGANKGKATITLPSVTADTECYVYVQDSYYTSGSEADGIQHVKSWRKPITILNN